MADKPLVLECKCGGRFLVSKVVLNRTIACFECGRNWWFNRRSMKDGEYTWKLMGRFRSKVERERGERKIIEAQG